MPIMILEIEDKKMEFNILPINQKVQRDIISRLPKGLESRAVYLNHIVKEPKMSIQEWSNIPSLIITNILKGIEYYIRQITTLQSEISVNNMMIETISNEIDGLSAYAKEHPNDQDFDRLEELHRQLESKHLDRDVSLEMLNNLIEDKKPLMMSKNVLNKINPISHDKI